MMRRPEKEMKDRETISAMLDRTQVGRIATVNRKGFPVIKAVNFLYADGKIYIHSSPKGEKVSDIRRGSPVCFEIDEPIGYVPTAEQACKADFFYRSILIKGTGTLLKSSRKKLEIFERLMEKYQPEGGYRAIPQETLRKTVVIEISIHEMTGKENLK